MTLTSNLFKNIFALFLLTIVAIATYSNAMRSEFLMDDLWMFQSNRTAYAKAKVESVILHKPIPQQLQGYTIDLSYRPLSQILPLANYLVFKNNFFGYHVVNLILFIFCVFMIFWFLQILFNDFFISLTASLLFTAHPINSLMVNYISAHIFSVQLLLMISCCLSYLYYHKNSRPHLLILSLLSFYLATLCHEMTLTLPLFLTWLTTTQFKTNLKNTVTKLWPFYALGTVLTIQWLAQASSNNEMFLYKNKLEISWMSYIAGLTQLWTWYITKLLFLQDVLLMYVLPVDKISITYGWIILIATSLLIILSRHLWSKDKTILWGLGWFAIGLISVVAGARFQPAYGLTIEPHWLYFSSLGLFLIAAKGLKIFFKYHPRLPFLLIGFLVLGYSLITYQLNGIWSNRIRYGEYFMAGNPDFEKARLFLANAYFREGYLAEAESLYRSSFKNIPSDWMPYNNLGVIADINGRSDEAIGYYQQLLIDHPDDPGILNNLASAYIKTNKLEQAENLLKHALESDPWMLLPRINMASVYEKQNRVQDAQNILNENLRISPHDPQTIISLIELQIKHTDKTTAIHTARSLLENSKDALVLKLAGTTFCRNQFISEGYAFYQKAVELSPGIIDPNVCYIIAEKSKNKSISP